MMEDKGMIADSTRNKQDLLTQLGELKTELASLRVQKIAGGNAAKLNKMWVSWILMEYVGDGVSGTRRSYSERKEQEGVG